MVQQLIALLPRGTAGEVLYQSSPPLHLPWQVLGLLHQQLIYDQAATPSPTIAGWVLRCVVILAVKTHTCRWWYLSSR